MSIYLAESVRNQALNLGFIKSLGGSPRSGWEWGGHTIKGDFTQGIGMDSRICSHFLTLVNSKWNDPMPFGQRWNIICALVLNGTFWGPFGPKWDILRPKSSVQIHNKVWERRRMQDLVGRRGLPLLTFRKEEEVQALYSPSPNLQWTLENPYLWGLLLRLESNQRVSLKSWVTVPRCVPCLNS